MAAQHQDRHPADLVLRQQDGDPFVGGAQVSSHHWPRHDVPDPVLPSAIVPPAHAAGMGVRTVLRPMALSGTGYLGSDGGLAARRLAVGDAKLTTEGGCGQDSNQDPVHVKARGPGRQAYGGDGLGREPRVSMPNNMPQGVAAPCRPGEVHTYRPSPRDQRPCRLRLLRPDCW